MSQEFLIWAVVWAAFYVVGTGLAIWSLRLWGPSAPERRDA